MEPVLLDAAVKGAVILALTAAVAAALRSASSAVRHLVWSTGMAATVVLPGLGALLPRWDVTVMEAPARPALLGVLPVEAGTTATAGAWIAIWAAGAFAVLAVFALGRLRVRWLARDAARIDVGPWPGLTERLAGEMGVGRPVRLLRSRRSVTPMMWGVVRPTILLPREADGWSDALKRDVILHELAHVKRHDYLSQLIARLACALHWFDPLAWYAARRLRHERERACDDRVLRTGSTPCDYAGHLLAVARWRSIGTIGTPALRMAHSSTLADRLKAILETGRRRTGVSRRVAAAHGVLGALLVLPLAALHPQVAPRGPDAEEPGGVLPLPPSLTAGAAAPETWEKAGSWSGRAAGDSSPAPAPAPAASEAAREPERAVSARPVGEEGHGHDTTRALHVDPPTVIAIAAGDVRLLSRAVVTREVAGNCSESVIPGLRERTPVTQSRPALVSAPKPVLTP